MSKTKKPYAWIPTLYFAEALPYTAVMLMSVVLYQEMGLTDTQITFYTGWLGLPWVIKPLWSPFIDSIRTKRWWIISMQLLVGAALACVALTLPTSIWLQGSLALFMLVAFGSATHDISADGFYILGLTPKDQELYVGLRNTFYRIGMVLGQGGLVMMAGLLQEGFWGMDGVTVPASWSIVFFIVSAIMLALFAYHNCLLPVVEDAEHDTISLHQLLSEFWRTLCIFFQKKHIAAALAFILLFRLPEGLLTKIVPLFLKRTFVEGGLGLTDVQYGFIYGTLGVIGLLGGGILGGILVNRYGLRRCLWPLVLCLTLPDIIYVIFSLLQMQQLWLVGAGIFLEQVGYGLGFTAYTLYLVHFSRGEHSTAIFSICTAFQYLGGVMLPGMVSGWLSDKMGYTQFFLFVMLACCVTFLVSGLVRRDLPKD